MTVTYWRNQITAAQVLKTMPRTWANVLFTIEVGERAALASLDGAR